MSRPVNNDPRWQEKSASLRDGKLFVKMPLTQARMLRAVLLHVLQVLDLEEDDDSRESKIHLTGYTSWLSDEVEVVAAANQTSVVYAATLDYATKDAEYIGKAKGLDQTGILSHFHRILEAGLRSDPEVDWIARVGGPNRDFTGLEQPSLDVSEIILDDLVPDPQQ